MAKFLIELCFSALCFLAPLYVNASGGVITGGGGGIVVPEHVRPFVIKFAVSESAGRILIPWLRKEELNFNALQAEEKSKSAFRKIFQTDQSIYSLIHDSSIEVREDAPCLDAEGLPHDGSIYAVKPNAICLSAYSMAPKLSYYNADAETLALAAHEYSHLLGTSEDEAVAIQKVALGAFTKTDFHEVAGKEAKLSLSFETSDWDGARLNPSPFYFFRQFINERQDSLSQDEVRQIGERIQLVLKSLITENQRFLFVPVALAIQADLQYARFAVSSEALCASNKNLNDGVSAGCKSELDLIFGSKREISFRDFSAAVTKDSLCRNSPNFCFSGPIFDQTISRPQTLTEIRAQFGNIDNYVQSLAPYVTDLVYCGDSSGTKNCRGTPDTWNPPMPANFDLHGTYNQTDFTVSCRGYLAWPHLDNVLCKFENGPGIKPDFDGTISFKIRSGKDDASPWSCFGKNLDALKCVQPFATGG